MLRRHHGIVAGEATHGYPQVDLFCPDKLLRPFDGLGVEALIVDVVDFLAGGYHHVGIADPIGILGVSALGPDLVLSVAANLLQPDAPDGGVYVVGILVAELGLAFDGAHGSIAAGRPQKALKAAVGREVGVSRLAVVVGWLTGFRFGFRRWLAEGERADFRRMSVDAIVHYLDVFPPRPHVHHRRLALGGICQFRRVVLFGFLRCLFEI